MLVMLANLLHSNGHQSAVLTTVAPGALAGRLHAGVTQVNLARPGKWNLLYMRRMIKILNQCDVVHVHSGYNLRYVYVAAILFGLRKRIFFHEHFGNINIDSRVSWHQKLILPHVIFIAVSKQLAQWAVSHVKLSTAKVFILPNTILKDETIPAKPFEAVNKLLLVSNFRRQKNLEFAIEVLKNLHAKDNRFRLTIAGQKVDAAYYLEIIDLIKKHRLEKAVEIVTDCSSVQQLLPQYTLAIHTAHSETGPLVLIEYAAHGLPFISYNTGEVIQTIKQHLPQLIMQDFNVARWVQQIENLTSQPQPALQQRLVQLYNNHFSPQVYYETCISIYKQGLSKP